MPFRHFPEDDPEYLVAFWGYDLSSETLDAPLAEMHDKLVARHCQPELLRFVGLTAPDDASATPPLWLGSDEALSYREFKRARKHLRATEMDKASATEG